MPTSTASVETKDADRYRRQLLSHLGRKSEVEELEDGAQRLVLPYGSCLMRTQDDALLLEATADTDDDHEHVEQVVARHLERFGRREGLGVVWQPS